MVPVDVTGSKEPLTTIEVGVGYRGEDTVGKIPRGCKVREGVRMGGHVGSGTRVEVPISGLLGCCRAMVLKDDARDC